MTLLKQQKWHHLHFTIVDRALPPLLARAPRRAPGARRRARGGPRAPSQRRARGSRASSLLCD